MPRPRLYSTDAERYKAYRERKKERIEALAREVKTLKRSATNPSPQTLKRRQAKAISLAEFHLQLRNVILIAKEDMKQSVSSHAQLRRLVDRLLFRLNEMLKQSAPE